MNQPLGNYIGNWLEVLESIKILKGEVENDLYDLSMQLSGAMIYLGKKASSIEEGIKIAKEKIKSGEAFDKFIQIAKLQNGDVSFLTNPEKYPKSKFHAVIKSSTNGFLKTVDTFELGMFALELGAGRKTKEDKIEPKAGIIFNYKIGDKIKKGDVIAEIFSDNKNKMKLVEDNFLNILLFQNQKFKNLNWLKK